MAKFKSAFAAQVMKMGWDVSDLTDYTNEESEQIITKQVFVGDTLSRLTIQENVQYKEKIKLFNVDVVWQDGDDCDPNASGVAKFSDRQIEVSNIVMHMEFCNLDLIKTWTQKALRAGAIEQLEDFPYEQVMTNHLLELNAAEMEDVVWNGDVTLPSGNRQYFDGFEKLFNSVSAAMIDINTNGYTVIDDTNAYDVIFNAYRDMKQTNTGKAVLKNGNAAVMITDNQIDHLVKNITDLNKFHFNTDEAADNGFFKIPGTKLIALNVSGREDDDKFYIGDMSTMILGTGLDSDRTALKVWFDDNTEKIKFTLRFKAGVQIAYPEEFGYFELAAS